MRRSAPTALFLIVLATRVPFATRYLFDWDSVQFALGIERFDMVHHQPHPPGYVLYLGAAQLLSVLTRDVNAGFVVLSILASAAATVMVFLLAEQLVRNRTAAILVALAFAFNPFFWFYGEVALNYSGDAFISVAAAYVTLRILREKRAHLLLPLTALLALYGGYRQSSTLLLLPLWILSFAALVRAKRCTIRDVLLNVGVGVGLTALWLVPLIGLAGGIGAFMAVLGAQAAISAGTTSPFLGAPFGATMAKAAFVGKTILAILHAALVVPLAVVIFRRPVRGLIRPGDGILAVIALVWVLPSLFVYLFIHMGGSGYLMTVAPALLLLFLFPAARMMEQDRGRAIAAGLFAFVIASGALSFLLLNDPAFRRVPALWEAAKFVERKNHLVTTFTRTTLAQRDASLDQILSSIRAHPPETTAIVTEIGMRFRPPGSDVWRDGTQPYFRHMGYYLPAYDVTELVGGEPSFFKTRWHAPASRTLGKDIPIPADTETIVIVTDYVDRDVQAASGIREELLLPSRTYLFWIDARGKDTVDYAGFTFHKSDAALLPMP